jgi:hypothetical protein
MTQQELAAGAARWACRTWVVAVMFLGCIFSEVVNVFDDIDYKYLTSREVFFKKKNVEKIKTLQMFSMKD